MFQIVAWKQANSLSWYLFYPYLLCSVQQLQVEPYLGSLGPWKDHHLTIFLYGRIAPFSEGIDMHQGRNYTSFLQVERCDLGMGIDQVHTDLLSSSHMYDSLQHINCRPWPCARDKHWKNAQDLLSYYGIILPNLLQGNHMLWFGLWYMSDLSWNHCCWNETCWLILSLWWHQSSLVSLLHHYHLVFVFSFSSSCLPLVLSWVLRVFPPQ